jgi:pyruvate/2-oxoglutarate dehydrogenase complex dihydrolipoamide dehydrogenase (E3) component
VPCIRCNDGCLHRGLDSFRSVGCTVNPEVAQEGRFPVGRAAAARRVAVVGGGPAGLRAAVALHDRGHDVTLFEKNELGGLLGHAAGFEIKQDLADLVRHQVHEVTRRGIRVADEEATATSLAAAGFEQVVVATGAPQRSFSGPADPAAVVLRPEEIGTRRDEVRGKVVVIGGGFQGCETALRLQEIDGVDEVTIVERGDALATGDEVKYDVFAFPALLEQAKATVLLGTEATAITKGGVAVKGASDSEEIAADVVITALGRESASSALADELRAAGTDVVTIGSADRPGRVFDALHGAHFAARLI